MGRDKVGSAGPHCPAPGTGLVLRLHVRAFDAFAAAVVRGVERGGAVLPPPWCLLRQPGGMAAP